MTRRLTTRRARRAGIAVALAGGLVAGYAGRSAEGGGKLRDGIYEFELTEPYLRGHGIPGEQARIESGIHRITLDRGSFVDRWRTAGGTTGVCVGVYAEDGNRVTVRWTAGCTGDWAMSYAVEGSRVRWSEAEPLDPDAGPAAREVTEVFNGVPWTRIGDVAGRGRD